MKIGFFTDTYFPDLNGVSISVSNFAKELRKNGHTVYIFAPKIKRKYKDTDKNLIRLPSIKILRDVEPQIYSPTIWLNKEFREMFTENFDILHAHGNGPFSLLGYFIAKIKRVPFVMTFHTIHTHYTHYIFKGKIITPKIAGVALKIAAQACDGVIAPSWKMKGELEKYGVKKQIHVVPNFLEIERFRNNSNTGFLHKLLGLSKDHHIILTVSRIGKEKNIDFILRVFSILYKKNKKLHLAIVGDGPEKNNLMELANTLGILDRVHFTGVIAYNSMPLVYKDSIVFVFASYTETQGICVLEAATAGVPCVVVKDEAFHNAVIDKENGFLLSLKEEEFAKKISYLIENKKIRQEMSKKAKEIVYKNFSPKNIIKDLKKVYSQTLSTYIHNK